MDMEIAKLIKYFEKIIEVKDACLKDQCILECDSMNVLKYLISLQNTVRRI